jgi:death-on-curing family protein
MSRRATRVSDLAAQAGLGLDEALVTLWEHGLEQYDSPDSPVPARQVAEATKALGIALAKEQLRVDYWLEVSGLDRRDFAALLAEDSIELPVNARRIPKGSLRYLRRRFADPVEKHAAVRAESGRREKSIEPFSWVTVGSVCDPVLLSANQIEGIHSALEADFAESEEPISPPGLKDRGLLEMAAMRPWTSFEETRKYPTVEMAAAALFHSVVHNHAFYNGNKRTALVTLLAVLDENDRVLACSQADLFKFTLLTAQHGLVPTGADNLSDREVMKISHWIRSNSRSLERQERPMKWHKLKRRLRDFNCTYGSAPKVGNRLNIERTIVPKKRFGRGGVILRTQVAFAGDGTEADRNVLRKIRTDLRLDEPNDVDSAVFYEGAELDAFIIDYRHVLSRLAKL